MVFSRSVSKMPPTHNIGDQFGVKNHVVKNFYEIRKFKPYGPQAMAWLPGPRSVMVRSVVRIFLVRIFLVRISIGPVRGPDFRSEYQLVRSVSGFLVRIIRTGPDFQNIKNFLKIRFLNLLQVPQYIDNLQDYLTDITKFVNGKICCAQTHDRFDMNPLFNLLIFFGARSYFFAVKICVLRCSMVDLLKKLAMDVRFFLILVVFEGFKF